MHPGSCSRVITSIYGAVASPNAWPSALSSVAEALDAVGAGYIIRSKQSGRVEWACFSGPSAESSADYIGYYAALDPYRPLLDVAPSGDWVRLSRCLPKSILRRDEWYNDFVLKCGIKDMLGARLVDSEAHSAYLGIHFSVFSEADWLGAEESRELLETLGDAARLHLEFRRLSWKSSVGLRALDHLAAGVIVTDRDARVIEMHLSTDGVIQWDDGLIIRNGRLGAPRAFEGAKLAKLIAAACASDGARRGRMLIGKGGQWPAYVLTVAPFPGDLLADGRPLAMVIVADLRERSPSATDLAEFFGLSQAESRLGAALMAGKTLRVIAECSGVKVTTLRTQLSSVLRKVGVKRQTDLIHILSNLQVIRPDRH